MTDAILFDCDGVLVDTEGRTNDAMAAFLSARGVALRDTDCRRRFRGLSLAAVAGRLALEESLRADPVAIAAAVSRSLASGVSEIPGAMALVRAALAAGLQVGVASSGSIEKRKLTLGQTELLPYFQGRLFSADHVVRGKPAPDTFIHAAMGLNVDIRRSVVIEGSLSGIRAGIASGARVLALCADDFARPSVARSEGAEPVFSLDEARQALGLEP